MGAGVGVGVGVGAGTDTGVGAVTGVGSGTVAGIATEVGGAVEAGAVGGCGTAIRGWSCGGDACGGVGDPGIVRFVRLRLLLLLLLRLLPSSASASCASVGAAAGCEASCRRRSATCQGAARHVVMTRRGEACEDVRRRGVRRRVKACAGLNGARLLLKVAGLQMLLLQRRLLEL